jgi:plastocyanin domain-containing protein
MWIVFLLLVCIHVGAWAPLAEGRERRGKLQEVTITLTDKGYQPERVKLRRGVPARLTFVRKFAATCATEIILEKYNIKRDLPLNQPVVIEFTPLKAGQLEYTCSMKMVGGKIDIK